MSSQLSVAQILASLEMASHKEQQAHHAQREAFHREQKERHATEHETVAKHYEAFKATAGGAAEIASRTAAAPPPQQQSPAAPAKLQRPNKLVARLVKELPEGEVYTASRVAAEVNRRYRNELKKPVTAPTVSTCLRRLATRGKVRLVKKGTAHIQAVYTRA